MGMFDNLFSKKQPKPVPVVKGKNPEAFDFAKEKQLLKEYKPYCGKRNSDEYYTAIHFIDFYYKFRNLNEKYLDKCIYYCNICIQCLDAPDMKPFIRDGATIPAFKKLIIIYEKKCDYQKAKEIAEQAIKYTNSKSKDDAAYYSKKMLENNKRLFEVKK
ncbi:MAG: hypothetical protein IKG98_11475 [Ruminococcus sp.]|nr:hypothetical protein [Ruminococcus sp.]